MSGCASYPEYPDLLWACDNPRAPWQAECPVEDRGEDAMTIGFYAEPDGHLLSRLRDSGTGVSCRIVEMDGRWAKVEIASGQLGYVNLDEPVTTTTPLQ